MNAQAEAVAEKLAGDLLEIAMESPMALAALVEVDKPHALRFADSVSVSRWGQREEVEPALLAMLRPARNP